MRANYILLIVCFLTINTLGGLAVAGSKKLVIAHRGASGYLPEHSLAAKAMAYAMDVDYIEQDLVMTKDDRIVVLHDRYLDRVTNVSEVFPKRKRKNGRYYVIDFTLNEVKQLEMTEGFSNENGKQVANFAQRFPIWKSIFRVSTFEEEIELIQGLNQSMKKSIGIYPEIKSPWFHHHEGKDISKEVLRILKRYGYRTKKDLIYLQCFDPNENQRIHNTLFPEFKMEVKLVQLIAKTEWEETKVIQGKKLVPYNYDWMFKPGAMQKIAEYADGIGPWKSMIVTDKSRAENLVVTNMVKEAHNAGLVVHPYTFRLDKGRIPQYASSFEEVLQIFYYKAGVDGVFTDFPDRAVNFLRQKESQTKEK